MEKRKIQATGGGGTYTVSLPKKWIKNSQINKKDTINVFTRGDGALILYPEKKEKYRQIKKINMNLEKNSINSINSTIRNMIGAYINGADTILIENTHSREMKKNIHIAAKNMLIGVEITQEENTMILQCIIDVSKLSIKKIIKNTYDTTNRMYEQVFESLETKSKTLAIDVIDQDNEVDRLVILAIRQLNSAANDPSFAELIEISGHDTLNYRAIVDYMELMADCCVNIARASITISENKIPKDIQNKLISISEKIKKIYSDVVYAFKYKEITLANKTIEYAQNTEKEMNLKDGKIHILTNKKLQGNLEAIGATAIILENMTHILHLTKNVAELVIDRGYKKDINNTN